MIRVYTTPGDGTVTELQNWLNTMKGRIVSVTHRTDERLCTSTWYAVVDLSRGSK